MSRLRSVVTCPGWPARAVFLALLAGWVVLACAAVVIGLQRRAAQRAWEARTREQIRKWTARVASHPDDAPSWHALAIAHAVTKGSYNPESVALLRRACQLDPDEWRFTQTLAYALYDCGQLRDSGAKFEEAASLAAKRLAPPVTAVRLRYLASAAYLGAGQSTDALGAALEARPAAQQTGNDECVGFVEVRIAVCLWVLARYPAAERTLTSASKALSEECYAHWMPTPPLSELVGMVRRGEPPPPGLVYLHSWLGFPGAMCDDVEGRAAAGSTRTQQR